MPNKKSPKIAAKYLCKPCNYICSKKSDYNKHILTAKHSILINPNEKSPNIADTYNCVCGKVYKHMSSLCCHKKTCTIYNNDVCPVYADTIIIPNENSCEFDMGTQSNTVIELLRQNQEFKQLMVDQNKQMQETQAQLRQSYTHNTELQNQMVEMFKEGKTITNNHTSNRFNLNFFLNDTCKDAISITDFLRNMNVHVDELEYIGNHGYVNGMTKMIMDRLKDMDITKRPIHCTDIKRETMYIKDDSGWSKDTDELFKLRKILSRISMNNYRTVPDWRTAHPDCQVMETRNYEFCYKMMKAILGDVEDEQVKLDNKIIKTMAKELFVNKAI
jgi:hypothetical protein